LGSTVTGAAGAARLLMFVSAVAMLEAERGAPGSTVETFADVL